MCCKRFRVLRVSSAAIVSQVAKTSRARALKSPKLPIGVATTLRRPLGSSDSDFGSGFATIIAVERFFLQESSLWQ